MKKQVLNRLEIVIREYERKIKAAFKPNRDTYNALGVGQKRFAQLLKNKAEFTSGELLRFSHYFGVEAFELLAGTYQPSNKISLTTEPKNTENATNLGEWISKEEALKKLGIKNTKFWHLQTSGAIRISKSGRKIFVDLRSIVEFLNKSRVN